MGEGSGGCEPGVNGDRAPGLAGTSSVVGGSGSAEGSSGNDCLPPANGVTLSLTPSAGTVTGSSVPGPQIEHSATHDLPIALSAFFAQARGSRLGSHFAARATAS